ncbi:hypothetical protein [Anaerosinus massiliensis]|uniref:hypothetical protein n=1 Tax=Massilibacillus massiliensis TaxID=1806837 RepID=UPI000DA5FF0B|nr:hypothetical protein [Massilibacillus massiliensis]
MRKVERIWLGKMLKGICLLFLFILVGTAIAEMQIDDLTWNREMLIRNYITDFYQFTLSEFAYLKNNFMGYYAYLIKVVTSYIQTVL